MRAKLLEGFYFILIILIVIRLWYWQVINFESLSAKAETQRSSVKTLTAPRGEILFADESILASTKPIFHLYSQPKIIKDKEKTADILAKELAFLGEKNIDILTPDQIREKIISVKEFLKGNFNKDLYWVGLQYYVNYQTKQNLEKLNLAGIGFEDKIARFYPESSSSAHLLGFVGANDYGEETGYFGLEGYYNGELKGKSGLVIQDKDAQGLPILIGNFKNIEPRSGKTLILNIDRTIQSIVEEKLKKGMEKYLAKQAMAIVLEPKTGAILSLAAYPGYDPAKMLDFPKEHIKNPLTTFIYEPGSTFKTLVMAAGINEGVITKDTICNNCGGPLNIYDYTIRTWNNKYYPNSTMTEVLVHSDNTGMVYISKKLGLDKMYDYLQKFGLGKLTNVDLQDEEAPSIREKSDWKEIDLATASFGQGISVTPIQLISAMGAIANDGILMEPHIVKSIKNEKNTQTIFPKEIARPFSQETAIVVKDMMVKAVEEGEAKYLKPKGFKVAGKTGTAQIPLAGHYDPEKTIASFIGFAPANDPKFIMYILYNQPSSSIYGSETAAPTFFEIAKELFTYMGIAPSE